MPPSIAYDLLWGKTRRRFTVAARGLTPHVRKDADLADEALSAPEAGQGRTFRRLLGLPASTEHLACEF